MAAGPLERYRAAVAGGHLTGDAGQERIATALDGLASAVEARKGSRRSFFSRRGGVSSTRGLYIHGPVGRGKSMLMDLFFDTAAVDAKRRVHFHAFMAEVHRGVKAWRDRDADDPVGRIARDIAGDTQLLCFDEFQVTDIADAMILSRLLKALFDEGVVIVATSNRAPDELYENGINRQLFLPAIALIEEHMSVMALEGPIDYRLAKLGRARVYFTPLGKSSDAALDEVWHDLTGVSHGAPRALSILGRNLTIPEQAKGVARFTFEQLCAMPLGPNDYLAIAEAFHALVLRDVPVLRPEQRNETKRFLTLIDALYERSVKFICSAAAAPDALCPNGEVAREFERAASRLIEMQTTEYLARPHQPREAVRG
ncbi:MAG: cell division protein ZapE [Alphaproteobacteria bacterium]|nr:cell division protein ZapE [Alphaproteobacteria bacterium]